MLRALAAVALLVAAGPTRAGDAWTPADVVLETAFGAALVADWLQTRQIVRTPDAPGGVEESNPLLGRRPSAARATAYFAAAGATHLAIAWVLPRPWRTAWQAAGLTVECLTIRSNLALGLRVSF